MSRPWTGWVLTAAAIAAGPAPALSSKSPNHASTQVVAQGDAVPPVSGHTDCLEVTLPHVVVDVRRGEVFVLKGPYPTSKANGNLHLNKGIPAATDEQLRAWIERSKGDGADEDMQWLLLPDGKLVPKDDVQPTEVRAACGIPKGLTLLLPSDE